jgi:SAM-dependent methyltransferase
MSPETIRALTALNRRFYRTHAARFDASRREAWPGFGRIWEALPEKPRRVLDVGCGNGRFGASMGARVPDGHYLGVDACRELLAACRRRSGLPSHSELLQLDAIAHPAALPGGPFDLIAVIALLHHVPGRATRANLLAELARRLAPGGTLLITRWRLGAAPELDRLQLPASAWRDVPIDPADLEPGDLLLSFDGGSAVPRYCHALASEEIRAAADAASLACCHRFRADGRGGAANDCWLLRAAA